MDGFHIFEISKRRISDFNPGCGSTGTNGSRSALRLWVIKLSKERGSVKVVYGRVCVRAYRAAQTTSLRPQEERKKKKQGENSESKFIYFVNSFETLSCVSFFFVRFLVCLVRHYIEIRRKNLNKGREGLEFVLIMSIVGNKGSFRCQT